jgi:hypothetical protein
MKLKSIFLLTFLLLNCFGTKGQTKINSELLIGTWKFVRFIWPNFVPENAKIINESNNTFKDATYQFTKDKRLIIIHPNDKIKNNSNLTYVIKANNIYVSPLTNLKGEQLIIEVDILDKKTLQIYVRGFDPVGIFKRVK